MLREPPALLSDVSKVQSSWWLSYGLAGRGLGIILSAGPALLIIAFIPAAVRGTKWFFQKPEPLDVKKLGWSEMRQGVIFGTLAALAFIPSSLRS